MITLTDIIDEVWAALSSADELETASLTGGVYKLTRPLNSRKEDIVVNGLMLTTERPQRGVVNVNIFVPNLKLNNDQTQPNYIRLASLMAIFAPLLEQIAKKQCFYFIENMQILNDEQNREYYVNFRLQTIT